MTTAPNSFKTADAILTGRNRESRKIAHNTYLHRRGESIAVQLHNTDVVTFHPDGSLTLDTDGWNTITTRDRINGFTPTWLRMWTERGTAKVSGTGDTVRFFDGIVFGPRGGCRNPLGKARVVKVDAAKAKREADIKTYVNGWIETVVTGQMPLPSGGDCWSCCLGMKGTDHLALHLEEQYHVPSLIVLAVEAKGYPNVAVALQFILGLRPDDTGERFRGDVVDVREVRTLLTAYLRKNL